jgi:esterase/lipase superfamily enzyme
MYFVTNRKLSSAKEGLKIFGDTPNPRGSNELRLVKVDGSPKKCTTEVLADKLKTDEVQALKDRYKLDISCDDNWYASLKVACELFDKANRESKSILIFVHGYNNNVEDVFRTATEIERKYDVIVVPFTWPANGGGALSGTAAYLDDKKDARASTNALDSLVRKIAHYHEMLTLEFRRSSMARAEAAHPDNPDAARGFYTRLLERGCKVKINLTCHSMGNYLLKYSLLPSSSALASLVFDNVALIAADANNENHSTWLQRIQVRNRVYVVINENDSALGWSRCKPGKEQLARLGHYLRNLNAKNAYYINITQAKYVGGDHSYFKGKAANNNKSLLRLFRDIFQGYSAEQKLSYRADINAYELK